MHGYIQYDKNQKSRMMKNYRAVMHHNQICLRGSLRLNNSARNEDQKLAGRFLKIGYFIGY